MHYAFCIRWAHFRQTYSVCTCSALILEIHEFLFILNMFTFRWFFFLLLYSNKKVNRMEFIYFYRTHTKKTTTQNYNDLIDIILNVLDFWNVLIYIFTNFHTDILIENQSARSNQIHGDLRLSALHRNDSGYYTCARAELDGEILDSDDEILKIIKLKVICK